MSIVMTASSAWATRRRKRSSLCRNASWVRRPWPTCFLIAAASLPRSTRRPGGDTDATPVPDVGFAAGLVAEPQEARAVLVGWQELAGGQCRRTWAYRLGSMSASARRKYACQNRPMFSAISADFADAPDT